MDMSGFQKDATYEQIKAYISEHISKKFQVCILLRLCENAVCRLGRIIIVRNLKMQKYRNTRWKKGGNLGDFEAFRDDFVEALVS